MTPVPSISIVVPALNEEGTLAVTLDEILDIMKTERIPDFEILVFDDGSTDKTGSIADAYAGRYAQIRVIHNPAPQGLGNSYKRGIRLASKSYYLHIHGDNEILASSIRTILRSAGQADFIVTYLLSDSRPLARQIISRNFTRLFNTLFGLKIKYYNGPNLFPLKLLKDLPILTNGHAFMAEMVVRLAKKNYSYAEIGFHSRVRAKGKSKAFRIKNIASVIRAIWRLRLSL